MNTLSAQQLRESVRRQSPPPQAQRCLEVSRIAKLCPASAAGVVEGDWLLTVDGKPAGALSASELRDGGGERVWTFFSKKKGEQIQVRTTSANPGVTLRPTSAAIAANPQLALKDTQRLLWLWESGDHRTLAKVLGVKPPAQGLLSKLFKPPGPPARNSPAYLMEGAALYELGDRRTALSVIGRFAEEYLSSWTTHYHAVVQYYLGREAEQRGARDEALRFFSEAFRLYPCPRISTALATLAGQKPEKATPWLNRRFPLAYTLPRVDGGGTVSLMDALAPGRLVVVCLLATYRGNGPYNEFLESYLAAARALGPEHLQLHVVTMEPERDPARPHWFTAEDRALQERIAFEVLLEDGSISQRIQQQGSPHVLVLSPEGMVVHEGEELSGPDLWDALARIGVA